MKKIILALLLLLLPTAALAVQSQFRDITCETTSTTGTSNLTLTGASGQYLAFATQVTSGSLVPYGITSADGKVETGIGTFTAPSTLTRDSNIVSTSGVGVKASITAPAVVCLNVISPVLLPLWAAQATLHTLAGGM